MVPRLRAWVSKLASRVLSPLGASLKVHDERNSMDFIATLAPKWCPGDACLAVFDTQAEAAEWAEGRHRTGATTKPVYIHAVDVTTALVVKSERVVTTEDYK